MRELDSNKIKKMKSNYNTQFGVPLGGRGRLGDNNIYITKTEAKEKQDGEKKATVADSTVYVAKAEEKAVVESAPAKLTKKDACEKSKKSLVKSTIDLFKPDSKEKVVSVNAKNNGRKLPLGSAISVMFFMVLMMFVIINYVQIFENQTMINELRESIEQSRETERKLTAELEQKYDLSQIGDYASSELGMVGSENNKKVYVDIDEEDSIEVHEPETEDFGTIATIMNALGDTVKAWIDVFE